MAFTSTDLANVEKAIVSLSTGARAVKVTIGGKTIQYSEASLETLKSIRDLIKNEVSETTVARRTYAKQGGRGEICSTV